VEGNNIIGITVALSELKRAVIAFSKYYVYLHGCVHFDILLTVYSRLAIIIISFVIYFIMGTNYKICIIPLADRE